MDNYDLTNSPLLGHCADTGESHFGLTEEQNRRATFSGRSAAFSTLDQAELRQLSLTYGEQISEQRVLANFDISSLPSTRDRATSDEPEDPFAALAAYQPPSFDDNSQHPSDSELGPGSGFLEGFTAEDLTYVVVAEPEGNDFLELSVQSEQLEQPEQLQGESDTQSIIIIESATSDTVSDKHSGKRRALEPRNVLIRGIPKSSIEHSIEMHFQKSLCGSKRLTKKRQKLDSTDSATSQKHTRRQDPDEILQERVNKETEKWIVKREDVEKRYMCSYPNCGYTSYLLGNLKTHIFRHIHISTYKCPYPECADNPYFCHSSALKIHVRSYHEKEKPYHCTLCDKRFGLLFSYKRHMYTKHKIV